VPNCVIYEVCGLPDDADPEKRLCILHSRNVRKAPEAFMAALQAHCEKSHNFRAFVFPRDASFAGARFPEGADFSGASFLLGAYFSGAEFGGDTTFAGATFAEAHFFATVFTAGASFARATFDGKTRFTDATFAVGASFHDATFAGDADFTKARFARETSFAAGTFAERGRFAEAQFTQEANFFRTKFAGAADFAGTTFCRGARFAEATFQRGADFDGVAFQAGRVDFAQAVLLGPTRFAPRRIRKEWVPVFGTAEVDFRAVRIEPPESLAFVEVNLERCRFVDTDLRGVRLTGLRWAQLPWGLWARVGARDAVYDEQQPERYAPMPWAKLEDLYRQLKKNYEEQRDFDRAGDFHFGEKEMRRRNPATPRGLRRLLTLYRGVSGYGELWLRPLAFFLALVLAGALGYLVGGLWVRDPVGPSGSLLSVRAGQGAMGGGLAAVGESLLYSLRVMTLLRPDDVVPVGWSRLIQTVQSLVGPVLLGLAGLAIRQRLRR